jgi:recombinational DNA repair ATPase RecF
MAAVERSIRAFRVVLLSCCPCELLAGSPNQRRVAWMTDRI